MTDYSMMKNIFDRSNTSYRARPYDRFVGATIVAGDVVFEFDRYGKFEYFETLANYYDSFDYEGFISSEELANV
jgi:hypothetical protein